MLRDDIADALEKAHLKSNDRWKEVVLLTFVVTSLIASSGMLLALLIDMNLF